MGLLLCHWLRSVTSVDVDVKGVDAITRASNRGKIFCSFF